MDLWAGWRTSEAGGDGGFQTGRTILGMGEKEEEGRSWPENGGGRLIAGFEMIAEAGELEDPMYRRRTTVNGKKRRWKMTRCDALAWRDETKQLWHN